jgi:hypothetical protein
MWHVPINATERSLLYASETFEQFEQLLQFFERLDNEGSAALWAKIAGDLAALNNAISDSCDDEFDEYYDALEENPMNLRRSSLWNRQQLSAPTLRNCLK